MWSVWSSLVLCSRSKQHLLKYAFYSKVIKPEVCVPCGMQMKLGKLSLKCRVCQAVTHPECRAHCPLPCTPTLAGPQVRIGRVPFSTFCFKQRVLLRQLLTCSLVSFLVPFSWKWLGREEEIRPLISFFGMADRSELDGVETRKFKHWWFLMTVAWWGPVLRSLPDHYFPHSLINKIAGGGNFWLLAVGRRTVRLGATGNNWLSPDGFQREVSGYF